MNKARLIIPLLLLIGTQLHAQKVEEKLSHIISLKKMNCDTAILAFKEAENYFSDQDSAIKARFQMEFGLTYYCLGDFENALKCYQQSVSLFESTNNRTKQIEVVNLIGTLHKKQGDMDLALEYFENGRNLALQHSDSLGLGNSLTNIGLVYLQTNRFEEALEYFLTSTQVKASIKDTVGLSYNYDNLGITYSQLGNFTESEKNFELAMKYKQLIGDENGAAIIRNNLGEMHLMNNRLDKALTLFESALKTATKTNFRDFKQHVLLMLSMTHEKKGDYKNSLTYYQKHVALKDSLFNESRAKQLAEMEAVYQNQKRKQELELKDALLSQEQLKNQRNKVLLASSGGLIVLLVFVGYMRNSKLKWKNKQLLEEQKRLAREAEMNAVISSQEKERNRFARDLHDGFGQLISTLNLNLKNLSAPKNRDERERVFDASAKVLEEMYQELKNICFDLMPQTLIKHGLEAALNEFANRINVSGQKFIEVNVFGLDERLSELQEISLYRISQEWVNNILKYSDASKITLQITKDESELTLLIEDDGIGFNQLLLTKGTGNGWKNITSRANLIHGELVIDNQVGVKGNSLILNAVLQSQKQERVLVMS